MFPVPSDLSWSMCAPIIVSGYDRERKKNVFMECPPYGVYEIF